MALSKEHSKKITKLFSIRKETLFMKSKKLVGLFAAALLVVPLAGCGNDDDCDNSQANQVSCDNVGDSGGIDID